MIETLEGLTSAITSYLYDRKDLAPTIPYFIESAERKLYRRLRIPANERLVTYTLETTVDRIVLPDDYMEAKLVTYGAQPLNRISDAELLQRYEIKPAASVPNSFARIGEELIFHPPPSDDTVIISLIYWADFSGNLLAETTSPIFDIAPDLYLHGALLEASAYLGQDSRIGVWKANYDATLIDLQQQAADEEFSGTGLAVQNLPGSRENTYAY